MDFTIFWFWLLLSFCWSQSRQVKDVCGVVKYSCPPDVNAKVSGGQSTCAQKYPWNVIIENRNQPLQVRVGVSVWCGGVLVTERHVLSAAHCFWKNTDNLGGTCPDKFKNSTPEECRLIDCDNACIRVGPRSLTLYFGITSIQDPGLGLIGTVEQIYIHPGWDKAANLNQIMEGHDLAVLTLRSKVDLSLPNINPVCLPTSNTLGINAPLDVVGFGVYISPSGEKVHPTLLQRATVYTVSKDYCKSYWPIRGSQICAAANETVSLPGNPSVRVIADSCEGDSGGSLTATTGSNNRAVLYGLTSFGEVDCGREGGLPGVYTNVYEHMDWITPIISDLEGVCSSNESCLSLDHPACSQLVCSYKAGRITKEDLWEKRCAPNPRKFCCEKKIPDNIGIKVISGSSITSASATAATFKVSSQSVAAAQSLNKENLDIFLDGVSCDSEVTVESNSNEEVVCGPDELCLPVKDEACSDLVRSFKTGGITIPDLKAKICSTSSMPRHLCCKASKSDVLNGDGGSSSTLAEVTETPAAAFTISSTGSESCSQKKVVCYYPNWAHYRAGLGSFKVKDIDLSLCTHIVYAYATLNESSYTMNFKDAWLDIDLKNYEKFVGLRAQSPNKKFLIALGGWSESRTSTYPTLLASADLRVNFVTSAVEFITKNDFDGLDFGYLYPAYQQSSSEKSTFAALVKELKTAFEPHGWELTAAVSGRKDTIEPGYDVPEISKYLDAIHLMTYNFHGDWESAVDHHAPLYSSSEFDELSVDVGVKYWLSQGAPKSKLIVGIPTYGQSWTLSSTYTNIGSAASGAGSQGSIAQQTGMLSYQEICLDLKNGWTVVDDPTGSHGPYAFKGNQWVGYDDPAMARRKAQYILDNDLGGAMFWDLASDDFNDRCGEGRYPIISAVDEVLTPC